jgi:hypothetical protein
LGAKHPGFEMTAMEIIDATLLASGWPDAETVLRERWIDAYAELRGHAHFRRLPARRTSGFISLPTGRDRATAARVHAEAAGSHGRSTKPPADRPFRLVTAPARSFLNTSFTEMPSAASARDGRRC